MPVQVEMQLSIKGGRLKTSRLVQTCKEKYEDEEITLVTVSNEASWLCEMVSGKAASRHPLKRTSVLQQLRRLLSVDGSSSSLEEGGSEEKPVPAVADKMDTLGFDDSEPEVDPTPKKRRRKQGQLAAVVPEGVVVKVPAPSVSSSLEEKRSVRVMKKGRFLWLEMDALPWLVHALRQEYDTGGLPSPPPEQLVSGQASSGIYWDFRDDRWIAKVVDHTGEIAKRSGAVRRRMVKTGDLCKLTFLQAKARVYDEMAAWLAEAGTSSAFADDSLE